MAMVKADFFAGEKNLLNIPISLQSLETNMEPSCENCLNSLFNCKQIKAGNLCECIQWEEKLLGIDVIAY